MERLPWATMILADDPAQGITASQRTKVQQLHSLISGRLTGSS